MYVYFSVILLCNDRVRRPPIAMAQALAIHYAISLLALTLLLSDKIFLYELDLGGSCYELSDPQSVTQPS